MAIRAASIVLVLVLAFAGACSDPALAAVDTDGGATTREGSIDRLDHHGDAPGIEPTPSDADVDLDANAPLQVTPAAFIVENEPLRVLHEGDAIALIAAPQGGHVALVAAKVKNVVTTAATLRVRMRRPDTGFIVAEEKRTVAMVPVPGEADTLQPDLRSRSQVAHVPLCPDYDPIDVVDQPLDVEVEVTPLYVDPPRVGRAVLQLRPRCSGDAQAASALCLCECEANYVLGKCSADAGGP